MDKLVAWLVEQKPDVVCLSNSLLIGVARRVREELRVPIICSLQGEDAFLDSLPEPYRERCWQLVQERAADVDRFVAPSRYYNALMQERLRLAPEKIVVIYNGIDLDGFAPADRAARVSDSGLSRADVPATKAWIHLSKRSSNWRRGCPMRG